MQRMSMFFFKARFQFVLPVTIENCAVSQNTARGHVLSCCIFEAVWKWRAKRSLARSVSVAQRLARTWVCLQNASATVAANASVGGEAVVGPPECVIW